MVSTDSSILAGITQQIVTVYIRIDFKISRKTNMNTGAKDWIMERSKKVAREYDHSPSYQLHSHVHRDLEYEQEKNELD
jgi:hypothetical protein